MNDDLIPLESFADREGLDVLISCSEQQITQIIFGSELAKELSFHLGSGIGIFSIASDNHLLRIRLQSDPGSKSPTGIRLIKGGGGRSLQLRAMRAGILAEPSERRICKIIRQEPGDITIRIPADLRVAIRKSYR